MMSSVTYKYVADSDAYDSFLPKNTKDYDVLRALVGQPVAQRWKPLRVKIYEVGQAGDFPRLTGHVPVFSKRAQSCLLPLIGSSVEMLPLATASGSYAAAHVLDVTDCLDLKRSEISWLDEDQILSIDRYAFKSNAIRGKHIFRIKQDTLAFTYVSDEFRLAVEEAELQGLIFEEVWR